MYLEMSIKLIKEEPVVLLSKAPVLQVVRQVINLINFWQKFSFPTLNVYIFLMNKNVGRRYNKTSVKFHLKQNFHKLFQCNILLL